jgi:hypothetical protein
MNRYIIVHHFDFFITIDESIPIDVSIWLSKLKNSYFEYQFVDGTVFQVPPFISIMLHNNVQRWSMNGDILKT